MVCVEKKRLERADSGEIIMHRGNGHLLRPPIEATDRVTLAIARKKSNEEVNGRVA